MTADLSTVKYKREPLPAITDEQKLKTYFSDELQRVENTLNNHERIVQSVSTVVDGNKGTFDSYVTTQAGVNTASAASLTALAATTAANTAAISTEQTARADADSAVASSLTTLSATVTLKNTTFTQDDAPTVADDSIVTGDLWVDSNDGNKLYRWNGTNWIDIVDGRVTSAISDAATAQAAADGKIDSFYQDDAPASASEGDIWFDTDDGNKIYTRRSDAWVATQDSAIATALQNAADADAKADGKVTTFYQDDEPTAEGTGDLWVDTNDGNKLYRWNGTTWQTIRDDGIAANADEAVTIASNLTAEATARANADAATTKVVNAQRALFGAAVADTWVSGATYTGSVNTDTPPAATGDEVVVSGIVYRASASHTAATSNKPANTDYWDAVDTVDAKVAAGVVTASAAHTTAGYAAATAVTALTSRMTAVDGNGQNAGDVFNLNASIATANSVISTDRDNVSARFGITVPNNYDSAKTYAVGEYAVYNALLYICIQAATGKIPSSEPQYWTLQTTVAADVAAAISTERTTRVSAEEAIAERTDVVSARIGVPPSSGTNFDSSRQYAIDDEVVHNSGKVYKVTATPPVGTVPTNTSYWAEQSLLSAAVTIEAETRAAADTALQTSVATAIANAATSQAAADGKIDSFYQDDEPSTASEGDLWFDTNDGNKIYTHRSGTWTVTQDSAIATALQDAADADAKADGKIATFYQDDAPTAEGIGDLWVDTNDGNKLYRWSGTAWVSVQDAAITTAQSAVNAKFGVTLDANGYVSGFESTNDGTTAIFQIAADKFSIRTPNTDSIPFQVDGNVVRMQNVEIGNNVIGLNSITHPHHATVTTVYASTLNSFTEVGSLAFTPTARGEVLFSVNFNNAAVNASNQVTASARVDYSIQLRLTVGSAAEFSMQGMNNLRIGGILTGHFGNSFLRTMGTSVINQLHTFKVYAKPTAFVSGATKLGLYNLSMSATELYR